MAFDPSIYPKYTAAKAKMFNNVFPQSMLMFGLLLLTDIAYLSAAQSITITSLLCSNVLQALICFPIWYLSIKQAWTERGPFILIAAFYCCCLVNILVSFRVFPWELDSSEYKGRFTLALYTLFGINTIDTRLLMVLVVPAYVGVGLLQAFLQKEYR